MQVEEIRTAVLDNVALITMDNRNRRNALTAAMMKRLGEALKEADSDPRIRCVILTGAGDKAFATGHDVNEFLGGPKEEPFEDYRKRESVFWLPAVMKKPVIAAVNGAAYAGGFILALNCDLRIVSPNAAFAATGARFGLMLIGGQVAKLPLLIPVGRAMDMLLTNRPLGAAEAVSIGFASSVAPEGQLIEEALKTARQIAGNSPLILRKIKEGINLTFESGVKAGLDFELRTAFALRGHPDAKEGIRAFLEKRTPAFADLDREHAAPADG